MNFPKMCIAYTLDPGIVLEKLVVDYGGYKKSYLFMNESKSKRDNR